ncbi:uncharacterized protein LOC128221957 [Mya arenaria]|uniref:uncharacterized protein LOC128221957 n=1 Tax=Mya arenaria TaxID=6604 RepID=UPI0022E7B899|nr:uncharacterized protein LOC128221957 [Mya arenaria]
MASQHRVFAALLSQPANPIHPAISTTTVQQPNSVLEKKARDANVGKRYMKIHDGLESSISFDGRERVSKILGEVDCLSDVEKLLLYLRLPTGTICRDDNNRLTPPSCLPMSNRKEQGEAFTWIRTHFEEHTDVCMPKAQVYDEYKLFCEQHGLRALCNADFGKVMRQVFPDINTRRLGQRGQSRYFYGGLRKRQDFEEPSLPELEISNKHIELDSSVVEGEVFKSSCELVLEWAEKVLDMRFDSVPSVAEHLVGNMYVNTRSVAAFTLIGALQDSGKNNLKGSALFTSQPSQAGDRHRETNLLLQQKLQKNRQLQKQKDKIQALKSENEQQSGVHGNVEQIAPNPGNQKRSSTSSSLGHSKEDHQPTSASLGHTRGDNQPSRASIGHTRGDHQPSPASLGNTRGDHQPSPAGLGNTRGDHQPSPASPLQESSPLKLLSPQKHEMSSWQAKVSGRASAQVSDKSVKSALSNKLKSQIQAQSKENIGKTDKYMKKTSGTKDVIEITGIKQKDNAPSSIEQVLNNAFEQKSENTAQGYKLIDLDYDKENTDSNSTVELNMSISDAQTPGSDMDVDQSERTHVKRLNFEDAISPSSSSLTVTVEGQYGHTSNKCSQQILPESVVAENIQTVVGSSETLSKSTGHLNFKKLLENQGESFVHLNKSMGFIEKCKNSLFVNQCNVPGRSAFVPFSQVQAVPRKDSGVITQSIAMAIPVMVQSVSQGSAHPLEEQQVSQSMGVTPCMIAVPSSVHASVHKSSSDRSLKESVLNLVSASSFVPGKNLENIPSSLIDKNKLHGQNVVNFKNPSHEAINVVTVTSVMSKMSGDVIVTSAQNLSGKQSRSKFTPIRPKASPNKGSPAKDTKNDNSSNYDKDKRRVSTILKEKREKQKAEALVKSQTGMQLPTIPFTPNMTFPTAQLPPAPTEVNTMVPNMASKDMVIIVNNQPVSVPTGLHSLFGPGVQILPQPTVTQPGFTLGEQTSPGLAMGQPFSEVDKAGLIVPTVKKGCENTEIGVENKSLSANIGKESVGNTIVEEKCLKATNKALDVNSLIGYSHEMDISDEILNSKDLETYNSGIDIIRVGVLTCDSVDQMWSETPSKIAKMNITSPHRPESACSIDREVSVRVARPESVQRPDSVQRPESVLSRPESACSFGRETPSGARKRKCPELQTRRDFKRLNSTGEEMGEDANNTSLELSPDEFTSVVPRRTKSCTSELEDECKSKEKMDSQQKHSHYQHKSEISLVQGLQSPDISCLEKDALIESFPNSVLAMKPEGRSSRRPQVSSVGISALKQSKPSLDQRVKNYFEAKKMEAGHGGRENKEIAGITFMNVRNIKLGEGRVIPSGIATRSRSRNEGSSSGAGLVVSDRKKPYQRPSSAAPAGGSRADMEPSGLPSDVADWITDTLEQRQQENKSAMSEPDLHHHQSLANIHTSPVVGAFQFETRSQVSPAERPKSVTFSINSPSGRFDKKNTSKQTKDDDNTFTVPKAPPITVQRLKEQNTLRSVDMSVASQRCQSLPLFASPARSPVSPVMSQVSRNHVYTRASSMSPRGPGQVMMEVNTDLLSPPAGPLLSPQGILPPPIRLPSPSQGQGQGHITGASNTFRDASKGGSTYLKKIQHSLQMPVDHQQKNLDKHRLTLNLGHGQGLGQQGLSNPQLCSQESSLEVDEQFMSQTPCSDSGYHSNSTEPSPIMNSTPVSAMEVVEIIQLSTTQSITESPITMVTDFLSPVQPASPHQSPLRQQLIDQQQYGSNMAAGPTMGQMQGVNMGLLRSSIHSAFVPIEGSHHDIRYVTPIKPTVTLPNAGTSENSSGETGNCQRQFIDQSQSRCCSVDPPPYDVALKQLQQQQHIVSPGNQQGTDMLGPFASKLVKLSKKSHSVVAESEGSTLNLLSPSSEGHSTSVGSDLLYIPTSELEYMLNNDRDNASISNMHLGKKHITKHVLDTQKNTMNIDLPSYSIGNPSSVLSIDPSYHLSSMSTASNPTYDSVIPPALHHSDQTESRAMDMDLLLNKPIFSLQKSAPNETFLFQSEIHGVPTQSVEFDKIKTKNVLIGGKDVAPAADILLGNQENPGSLGDRDLFEGFPLDTLKDFDGQDLAEFDMFNE